MVSRLALYSATMSFWVVVPVGVGEQPGSGRRDQEAERQRAGGEAHHQQGQAQATRPPAQQGERGGDRDARQGLHEAGKRLQMHELRRPRMRAPHEGRRPQGAERGQRSAGAPRQEGGRDAEQRRHQHQGQRRMDRCQPEQRGADRVPADEAVGRELREGEVGHGQADAAADHETAHGAVGQAHQHRCDGTEGERDPHHRASSDPA
jgi:hypothetical protein